jgi:hypothetical protein
LDGFLSNILSILAISPAAATAWKEKAIYPTILR